VSFSDRLTEVQQRIENAARKAGRAPTSVRLIAVSKKQSIEAVREAFDCGLREFGENYVQELVEKREALASLSQLRFHMIGHLQQNKVRSVVTACAAVHGLDSERLVLETQKRAAAAGVVMESFIQVNVASEAQKSGCSPAEVPRLVELALTCANVNLVGLMAIPPITPDAESTRPYFSALRAISERLPLRLPRLSMGMSSDYEVAIEEGATDVRVGTALFGARAAAN
jgi:pyridoxal phosphate enzyme (YggS family)